MPVVYLLMVLTSDTHSVGPWVANSAYSSLSECREHLKPDPETGMTETVQEYGRPVDYKCVVYLPTKPPTTYL